MYSGIGGLMDKTIRQVDLASLARVREAGFTGIGWSFENPTEVSLRDVDQLRSVMEEGCVELAQSGGCPPGLGPS